MTGQAFHSAARPRCAKQSFGAKSAQAASSGFPLQVGVEVVATQVPHITGHRPRTLSPTAGWSHSSGLAFLEQYFGSGAPLHTPVVVVDVCVEVVSVRVEVVVHVSHRTGHFVASVVPKSGSEQASLLNPPQILMLSGTPWQLPVVVVAVTVVVVEAVVVVVAVVVVADVVVVVAVVFVAVVVVDDVPVVVVVVESGHVPQVSGQCF